MTETTNEKWEGDVELIISFDQEMSALDNYW